MFSYYVEVNNVSFTKNISKDGTKLKPEQTIVSSSALCLHEETGSNYFQIQTLKNLNFLLSWGLLKIFAK